MLPLRGGTIVYRATSGLPVAVTTPLVGCGAGLANGLNGPGPLTLTLETVDELWQPEIHVAWSIKTIKTNFACVDPIFVLKTPRLPTLFVMGKGCRGT